MVAIINRINPFDLNKFYIKFIYVPPQISLYLEQSHCFISSNDFCFTPPLQALAGSRPLFGTIFIPTRSLREEIGTIVDLDKIGLEAFTKEFNKALGELYKKVFGSSSTNIVINI
jgi:hypothetical protein